MILISFDSGLVINELRYDYYLSMKKKKSTKVFFCLGKYQLSKENEFRKTSNTETTKKSIQNKRKNELKLHFSQLILKFIQNFKNLTHLFLEQKTKHKKTPK